MPRTKRKGRGKSRKSKKEQEQNEEDDVEMIQDEPPTTPKNKKRTFNETKTNDDWLETPFNEPTPKKRKITPGKHVDLDIGHEDYGKIGKNKYHHWSLRKGLNYAGKCYNDKCVAYKEPITMYKNFGIMDVVDDQEKDSIICPLCSKDFKLESIRLYKCNAKAKYRLLNDDDDFKEKEYTATGGRYVIVGSQDIHQIKEEPKLKNKKNKKKKKRKTKSRTKKGSDSDDSDDEEKTNYAKMFETLLFEVTKLENS